MNRPIKFRGVSLDTGEFVFGDLQTHFRTDGKTKSFVIRTWERLDDWVAVAPHKSVTVAEYHEHPVDPESVAQLVGYDKDGREVYEGDIVTDFFDEEFTAEILDGVITSEGAVDFVGGVEVLKLKEAAS